MQTLSRGQLTCERSRYPFPLQLRNSSARGSMQCGKISRKKHGVEFHFLSPWCDLLPCVVLVFPTCKVVSSLGLAVSTFVFYLSIFQISEESCWDLVAMDCIRYEESIYCRKRVSRISHICCNVSLT